MFQDVESLHNEKEQLRRQLQDEFSLKSPRDLSCLLSLQTAGHFCGWFAVWLWADLSLFILTVCICLLSHQDSVFEHIEGPQTAQAGVLGFSCNCRSDVFRTKTRKDKPLTQWCSETRQWT